MCLSETGVIAEMAKRTNLTGAPGQARKYPCLRSLARSGDSLLKGPGGGFLFVSRAVLGGRRAGSLPVEGLVWVLMRRVADELRRYRSPQTSPAALSRTVRATASRSQKRGLAGRPIKSEQCPALTTRWVRGLPQRRFALTTQARYGMTEATTPAYLYPVRAQGPLPIGSDPIKGGVRPDAPNSPKAEQGRKAGER